MPVSEELRRRLEGRVEALEAAAERYERLGRLLDARWVERAGAWRAVAEEVVAAEADVGEALARVQRHPEARELASELLERRQRLVDEVQRLAAEAGLAPAPWVELLDGLMARADRPFAVEAPSGEPLLRGPVSDGGAFAWTVAALSGGLGLLASAVGANLLGEHGEYLGVLPFGLGLAIAAAFGPGAAFVVHGRRLVRPGRAGQGFTLDLAAAECVETAKTLRVQEGGLAVEVPAEWPRAPFLRALVEAAKAGLLDEAQRIGRPVTCTGATLGGLAGARGGALLGWGELVLFVADVDAPEALACLTGRPPLPGVDAAGVLELVEVLDVAPVREALPRLTALPGVRAWALDRCRVSPFPPQPRGENADLRARECPLEIALGAETLTATLTWLEARDRAMSLGIAAPE